MTTRVNTRKTWYASAILLIVLGLIFVSCNSDDGGNPIAPQGETQSDFVASQGQTDQWGAYYTEGDSSFYVNVPEAGSYQLKYATLNEGPFYITFDTPESAILEVGLLPGHILDYACVSSGDITFVEQMANVEIKTSWKVTVYSVTDDSGGNVSWWNPGSDAQTLFTADPNSDNACVIEDGQLGDGIVEIDPPNKGNGGAPPSAPPGTYGITVTFNGTCTSDATVNCTASSTACTPTSVSGQGPSGTGTFIVPDSETATLTLVPAGAPCTSPSMTPASPATFTTTGSATVTENDAVCGSGGKVVSGSSACWYLGAGGATCNTVCAGVGTGASCLTDTATFAGWSGTGAQDANLANCNTLLGEWGYSVASADTTATTYPGTGCNYNSGATAGRLYVNTATTCAGQSSTGSTNAQRICACDQ